MSYLEVYYPKNKALEIDNFKQMDYFAVSEYGIPIQLMMENAGLHLANFVAGFIDVNQTIKIGIGNGNNGGGGLVAARRLAAWGYNVYLDIFTEITKQLPLMQLERALKFGAKIDNNVAADIWVDAYLGFSQRLPLNEVLSEKIKKANTGNILKISLDIPTGFIGDINNEYFKANKILTLAAPKKILYNLPADTKLFVADIGIPKQVYDKFESETFPFHNNNIIKIKT